MSPSASRVTCGAALQRRLELLLAQLELAPVYRRVFVDAPIDATFLNALMRNVYLEIASYQPHVTEATFTAVGRMPKHESLIKSMILQQVEEVGHAEMALRDYRRLGGCHSPADSPISPASAAVAAVCRFLAERSHPATYLGYMYLFEALTPVMASRIQRVMQGAAHDSRAQEFVSLHAVEDVRHTDQVLGMVSALIEIDPAAENQVLWGFDVFSAVYPLPVWETAAMRADMECSS